MVARLDGGSSSRSFHTGIAKPIDDLRIFATETPTNRPFLSITGPPELPRSIPPDVCSTSGMPLAN